MKIFAQTICVCQRESEGEREKRKSGTENDKKRYMDRDGLIGRLTVTEGEKKKEE